MRVLSPFIAHRTVQVRMVLALCTAAGVGLLALAGNVRAQAPLPNAPAGPGALPPPPGGPTPSLPQGGKPGLPTQPLQPSLPSRPLDPKPLQPGSPQAPGNPALKVVCPADGAPLKLTLEVTPTTVRSGTPVELRLSTLCPVRESQRAEFTSSSPDTDRAAGQTMVDFLNQIPHSFWQPDATSLVIRFTPRGLAANSSSNFSSYIQHPRRVTSNVLPLRIEGSGSNAGAPPPASASAPTAPRCDPVVTLNAIPTAVIGGANVPVDITFSCALAGESVVQIISSNENLLPRPPGGTVRMPANATRMQFTLQAARAGNGSVTLRAVLSQPAGRMSEPDSVIIQNN